MNQTAANATTEKQAGVMLDPSSWERILYGGGATLSSWRVNASVAVALDPKAALGLAIADKATAATHNNTYRDRGCAWFDILGREIVQEVGDSWPQVQSN